MAQQSELTVVLEFLEMTGLALAVKEGGGITICTLKSPESKLSTKRKLVDANNLTALMVKKDHLSVLGDWIVSRAGGPVLYKLSKNRFQKHTFISVSCSGDCDMDAVWLRDFPALSVKPEVSLSSLDSAGVHLLQHEKKVSQENLSEYRKFEIKGSWSGKDCAMRVTGSETIIAQMLPLDDIAEGFVVRVAPNINREFVATCFAAVYAMKSESRRRKNIALAGGKLLGGALVASSKFIYDCASGGC